MFFLNSYFDQPKFKYHSLEWFQTVYDLHSISFVKPNKFLNIGMLLLRVVAFIKYRLISFLAHTITEIDASATEKVYSYFQIRAVRTIF
jgi:hypothetical protein